MKTVSALALIAGLGLAAPVWAQTPSDVANGRAPFGESAEVQVSRDAGHAVDLSQDKDGMMKDKKGKHHGKKKHHGGKHHKKHEGDKH